MLLELQTAAGCVPCIGIRISRCSIILDNTGLVSCRCEVECNVSQQRNKGVIIIIIIIIVELCIECRSLFGGNQLHELETYFLIEITHVSLTHRLFSDAVMRP
jgi:hypothetical protein